MLCSSMVQPANTQPVHPHSTHWYWQQTLRLLPPFPLTSGQFSSRELTTVPPKIIPNIANWNLQGVLSHFFLKFQIHTIYRTPFIQLLSNSVDGKRTAEKKTNSSSTHPLRFWCFLFLFVWSTGQWPGLPLSLLRSVHFPHCDPSFVFSMGAVAHIEVITLDVSSKHSPRFWKLRTPPGFHTPHHPGSSCPMYLFIRCSLKCGTEGMACGSGVCEKVTAIALAHPALLSHPWGFKFFCMMLSINPFSYQKKKKRFLAIAVSGERKHNEASHYHVSDSES